MTTRDDLEEHWNRLMFRDYGKSISDPPDEDTMHNLDMRDLRPWWRKLFDWCAAVINL